MSILIKDTNITNLQDALILFCKHEVIELPNNVELKPVRHGRFIGTAYDGYADGNPVYYEWECSECGFVFEEDEPRYNYCHNCGAKMDVTDNDVGEMERSEG